MKTYKVTDIYGDIFYYKTDGKVNAKQCFYAENGKDRFEKIEMIIKNCKEIHFKFEKEDYGYMEFEESDIEKVKEIAKNHKLTLTTDGLSNYDYTWEKFCIELEKKDISYREIDLTEEEIKQKENDSDIIIKFGF